MIKTFLRIGKYSAEELLMYEEGGSRNELEKLINSLQLGEKVILMGSSTNISEAEANYLL